MKKLIIACFTVLSANSAQAQETGMKLWYDRPATQWVESLPLGNGRLGAMVYGDPIHEEFQKPYGEVRHTTIPTRKPKKPYHKSGN